MLAKMVCSCSRFRSEVAGSLILASTALSWSVRLDNRALRRSCNSSRFLLASRILPDSSVMFPLATSGTLGTTSECAMGAVSVGTSSGARCPALARQGLKPMEGSFSTGKRKASSASSIRLKVTMASCRIWLICSEDTGPKRPKYSFSTSILLRLGGTCITTTLTPPPSFRSSRRLPFRGGGCDGGGPGNGPRQVSGGGRGG
mmetsp:Transcript_19314/g.45720  ORF Transcript_19314/g.45720 Transcript_19314/m.45720 type:complete len:202 (-) Transcript_19314:4-609(-)